MQWIFLSNNRLESLPSDVFRNLSQLQWLYLYNNRLESLPSDVFRNLSQLQWLILYNNRLELLPSDVFRNLSQLQLLYLYNNRLESLQSSVFRNLSQLQTLFLYNNSLESLPSDVFRNLFQLRGLSLYDNRLESLPSNVFRNLFQLRGLYLSNNRLESLPSDVFRNLSQLQFLYLSNNRLQSLPSDVFRDLSHLQGLYLYNNRLQSLPSDAFGNLSQLQELILHNNSLESLPSDIFQNLYQLDTVSLYNNSLKSLPSEIFRYLSQLKFLLLYNNNLDSLQSGIFRNLSQLRSLFIYNNNISSLSVGTFHGLENLQILNLENNSINAIQGKAFLNLTKLIYVNLLGNSLSTITSSSFIGLNSNISVDNAAVCQCFLTNLQFAQCVPKSKKSPYLTCEQLLPSIVVKCFTWIFSFCAIVANTLVFIWGCQKMRSKWVHEKQLFFITNLALADLLMGLYLLIILSADQYYNEYFPSYTDTWHKSILCKFAGLLSILSSEASLLFLILIAVERIWAFRKLFITYNFSQKTQYLLALSVWIVALVISIVTPFLEGDKLYQFSDVCIGLPLARRLTVKTEYDTIIIPNELPDPGDRRMPDVGNWTYMNDHYQLNLPTYRVIGKQVGNYFSIGLFLGFNCLVCLIITFIYIWLFMRMVKSGHTLFKTDIKMAIKMGAIALTDLMCWLPIVIIGILAQTGVKELDPVVFPWITAFALPINSVINPFLYTTMDRVTRHFVQRLQKPTCIEMETIL